jgi:hypothetical protein
MPSNTLEDAWGHFLPVIDPTTTFRVFLQNPNGLSISRQPLALQQDLQTCQAFAAAVVCMPETNTNWDLPHLQEKFEQLLHHTWKTTSYQASKNPEVFLSDRQPGGTATLICDDWVAQIIAKGEDWAWDDGLMLHYKESRVGILLS